MTQRHGLFCTILGFSHARTLFTLASNLIRYDDSLIITFAVHAYLYPQLDKISQVENVDRKRLRILCLGHTLEAGFLASIDFMTQQVQDLSVKALSDLLNCRAPAQTSGPPISAVQVKPTMLLVDVFCAEIGNRALELKIPDLHIAYFLPTSIGNLMIKYRYPLEQNKPLGLLETPGLPSLYKHELFPTSQDFDPADIEAGEADAIKIIQSSCFSAIQPYPPLLEEATCDYAIVEMQKQGREYFAVGFQFADALWSDEIVANPDDKVLQFMEKMLEKHGNNSVLFVSLGSLFWPTKTWIMDLLVDVILERKMPTVFVLAGAFIPEEQATRIAERLSSSDHAISSKWVNQIPILRHPACGYVLGHGGIGTTFEALCCGLPSVLFPFGADQSHHAAVISQTLKAGIELLQVRDLNIGKPLCNYPGATVSTTPDSVKAEFIAVFDRLEGAEGADLRRAAQNWAEKLRKSHSQDSPTLYEKLLDAFGRPSKAQINAMKQ